MNGLQDLIARRVNILDQMNKLKVEKDSVEREVKMEIIRKGMTEYLRVD